MWNQASEPEVLRSSLRCRRSTSWPETHQGHRTDGKTRKLDRVTRVPRDRHVHVAIPPEAFAANGSTSWPAQERSRVRVDTIARCRVRRHESIDMPTCDIVLLQTGNRQCCTSRRFKSWTRRRTSTEWEANRIRFQDTERLRAAVCEHWARDAGCGIRLRTFPHVSLRQTLSRPVRPKTSRNDSS